MKPKTILNFSHPLSPDAAAQLEQQVGAFKEVRVEVQLDLDQPIAAQVKDILYSDAVLMAPPDYVVAPALAVAAYLVGQHFRGVPALWIKREGTPVRWVLGGIEAWK